MMKKLNSSILIIDDETIVAKTLTAVLQEKGFDVRSTSFGNQGLEWLDEGFDLVLLDLKLPDIEGLEVLKIIKRRYPFVAVIIMTAFASLQTAVTIMKEGAYSYIMKPFDMEELLDSIAKATEIKRKESDKDKLLTNLSLFYQISREMEGIIELQGISSMAASYLREISKIDVCAILIRVKNKSEFWFSALSGVESMTSDLACKSFKLDKQMQERLIKEKNALLIPELKTKLEVLEYIPLKTPKSLFVFPLNTDSKVVGLAMFVGSQHITLREDTLETITTISNEVALCIDNANRYLKLKDNYFETVKTLVKTMEDKEEFNKGYSDAVAGLAVIIAKKMNLPDEDIENIRLAGFLHDIGQIAISDNILYKKGKLSSEEFFQIKTHCFASANIIQNIDEEKKLAPIILYHHERYDGSGYPQGLRGERIPLGARILAVCDAYKAIISHRPYRRGLTANEAVKELERCSGQQFDPDVVRVFLEAFSSGQIL
ncbi:MAG: response regulator [Candidatus Omnitrophica bacterium]|nr:response regulator [Candidatus Omnitrophota bacterium]